MDFQDLNARRKFSDMGSPYPISFSDIHDWAQVSGVVLTGFHTDVICRLDKTWMETYGETHN